MERQPENNAIGVKKEVRSSPEVIVTPSDMARLLHDQAKLGFATLDDIDEGQLRSDDGLPPGLPDQKNGKKLRYFQINIDQIKTHKYMSPNRFSGKPLLKPVTRSDFPELPDYMFKDGYLQIKDNIVCAMYEEVYEAARESDKQEMRLRYQSLIPRDRGGIQNIPVKDEGDARFRENAAVKMEVSSRAGR